jgi:hypothetical protein
MKELKILLAEVTPIPDQYFWYFAAVLICGILIFFLKRDMDKKDTVLNKLVDDVGYLKIQSAVQEQQIGGLQKDVTFIKEMIPK